MRAGDPPWTLVMSAVTAAFAAGLGVITLVTTLPARICLASLVVAAVWAVSQREAVARIRLTSLLALLAVALPGLALLGPSLGMPGAREVSAFRIALVLFVLLAFWRIQLGPLRIPRCPSSLWKPLGLWYVWLAISAVWAPDKVAALRSLAVLLSMLILTACVAICGSRDDLFRRALTVLGGVFALTLVVGIGEALTGMHLPGSGAAPGERAVATAWFVNRNDLATYLALCWPFVLLGGLLARGARWRWLAVIALAISTALVFLSGSRTSLLSIAVATAACVAAAPRLRSWRSARRLWAGGAVLLCLFVGALVLANYTDLPLLRQFRLAGVAEDIQTGTGSGGARLEVARAGLTVVSRSYLLGVGTGNAESVVRQPDDYDLTVVNLHSWWLDVFVNSGVPGLALFLGAYGGLFVVCLRTARRRSAVPGKAVAAASAAALLSFTIGAFGPSTSSGFAPLWALLGVSMATVWYTSRHEHNADDLPRLERGST